MSEMPSTFDEYLNGLAAHNGNLATVLANDIAHLAALPIGEQTRLFITLRKQGMDEATIKELRAGMRQAQGKKTNRANKQSAEKKKSQATIIYELALPAMELFTAPSGEAYAVIPANGHHETHTLRSNAVRNYLAQLLYSHNGDLPGAQAKQDAISLLEYQAGAVTRQVYNRVGELDGKIYLDMANADWETLEVDADGWRIVEKAPIAFRRPKGMGELPRPITGGDVAQLKPFLNINEEDWPLIATWIVAAMWPTGPYPVPTFTGEHGSTKSTASKVLKELIDPNAAKVRGQPEDIRDLMVAAHNSWLLVYDNISRLTSDVSDTLCRIATGGGYTKRANYTDTEEILIDVQRPIVLNGIGDFVSRPDLMDRAIPISVPSMPDEKRKDEKTFWREFYAARPEILGAFLDVLSWSISALPETKLDRLPRMADFAKLAVTAEPALGIEPGTFMTKYDSNRAEGAVTILDDTVMVPALRKLIIVNGKWEGSPALLLEKLEDHATDRAKTSKQWPQSPKKLTADLKRLAPILRQLKVVDAINSHSRTGTRWTITRLENCAEM
jgi:hypothetical protein